jgi:hypothetical protein
MPAVYQQSAPNLDIIHYKTQRQKSNSGSYRRCQGDYVLEEYWTNNSPFSISPQRNLQLLETVAFRAYKEVWRSICKLRLTLYQPNNDAFLCPTIKYPDPQPNNIFASGDLTIAGFINWQHCAVLPLFLQCSQGP